MKPRVDHTVSSGQIWDNSKPGEKGVLRRIKPAAAKPSAKLWCSNSMGANVRKLGMRMAASGEALSFPGLRSWMVNFKDAQPVPQRGAIGVGIRARRRARQLTYTAFDRGR